MCFFFYCKLIVFMGIKLSPPEQWLRCRYCHWCKRTEDWFLPQKRKPLRETLEKNTSKHNSVIVLKCSVVVLWLKWLALNVWWSLKCPAPLGSSPLDRPLSTVKPDRDTWWGFLPVAGGKRYPLCDGVAAAGVVSTESVDWVSGLSQCTDPTGCQALRASHVCRETPLMWVYF